MAGGGGGGQAEACLQGGVEGDLNALRLDSLGELLGTWTLWVTRNKPETRQQSPRHFLSRANEAISGRSQMEEDDIPGPQEYVK